jgi:hypothetical protein
MGFTDPFFHCREIVADSTDNGPILDTGELEGLPMLDQNILQNAKNPWFGLPSENQGLNLAVM